MENVYIVAYLISDRSQYWSGNNLNDCIVFIRSQHTKCLYRWYVRIYVSNSNGKNTCIYSGNLGSFIFG